MLSPNTSKTNGIDRNPAKFLKNSAEVFLSIKLSTLSKDCKIAKSEFLFKKGANIDPKNYRPLLLLSLVSKKLKNQCTFKLKPTLINYFYHSVFRTNHSDFSDLTVSVDNFVLTGMNKQLYTCMKLVHLQKVFGTLEYAAPLEEMKYFCF